MGPHLRDHLERTANAARFPGTYNPLANLFLKYRVCMTRLYVETSEGEKVGAAFHIGDGWLVTAGHVLRDHNLNHAEYEFAACRDTPVTVNEVIYSDIPDDLALLRTDFSLSSYLEEFHLEGTRDQWKEDHVPLGTHLDDWLDDSLVMTRALVMGYPTISRTDGPYLVSDGALVNAIVDTYNLSRHPYFVISTMARGGFSGGPVISEFGFLIGVVTDAFIKDDLPEELGHAAVMTVEPLWELLAKHEVYPASNAEFVREIRGLPAPEPQGDVYDPRLE
jgi:S1-C subfamily serine protease